MFRDGQYLEVIKASDNCLATAVVTVQEKSMQIKEKRVSTNKWLDLEDWAALYKILEKALLRNVRGKGSSKDWKKCKWKKSIRQLDITYTFEQSENTKDIASVPIIRVNVSPAKTKPIEAEIFKVTSEKQASRHRSTESTIEKTSSTCRDVDGTNSKGTSKKPADNDSTSKTLNRSRDRKVKRYLPGVGENDDTLEEYVPDTPIPKKFCAVLNYIPSRKSTLERVQILSNEYTPTISNNKAITEVVRYVPNSQNTSEIICDTYEPNANTAALNNSEEYIPNSKGIRTSIEEYHPDFTSDKMTFDDSYVPSSCVSSKCSEKISEEHRKLQSKKHTTRRKSSSVKRNLSLFT